MKSFEFSERNVEQAVDAALTELGVTLSDIDVEVLDEGGSGLLGFGRKPARIRVTYKPGKEPVVDQAVVNNTETDMSYNPLADDACPIGVDFDETDNSMPEQQLFEKSDGESDNQQVQGSSDQADLSSEQRQERVQRAVSFVASVMRNLNIHGKMSSYFDQEGTLCLDIDGDSEDLGMAIGRRGETLDALQYLTNLAVNHHSEPYVRVDVDVASYRKRRSRNLGFNARRVAKRVARSGRSHRLEAMNSTERRQVHMALQGFEGINTYSEGNEPNRHVVIAPDRK